MQDDNLELILEYTSGSYSRWVDKQGNIRKEQSISLCTTIYYDENGLNHRLNGPAKEYGDKRYADQWWYHGTKIPVDSQKDFEKYLKLKAFW